VAAHSNASDPDEMYGSLELSYRQYRAELQIFLARRARQSVNVEDLVQEVYERLLRYPSLAPIKDPKAYLFQSALNVLRAAHLKAWTEEKRYVNCEPAELERRAEALSSLWIQEDGGHELAEEELTHVLNQLPRGCRVALVRQRRDGWTYQQIAQELGVSAHTVKDYLAKAYEHFRIHFSMKPTDRQAAKDRS
jgi:RNA polymerase sigma factor (sigma-70 family)